MISSLSGKVLSKDLGGDISACHDLDTPGYMHGSQKG